MALLYPTLWAAVADIAHPDWATVIYRFWRDSGYGVGVLLPGISASAGGGLDLALNFVAVANSRPVIRIFLRLLHCVS